jgi:HPt (histidine-containing phosphotransfer) domain-containing protein
MEDAPELMAKINDAFAIPDPQLLEKSAHALKGLMSNFVAKPCVELAQRFELAGKHDEIPSVIGELNRFTRLYELLCEELASLTG